MTTYESGGVNKATRALINIHNSPIKPTPFRKIEGTLGSIGMADTIADAGPITDTTLPAPDASAESAVSAEQGTGSRIMLVVRTLAKSTLGPFKR